MANISVYVRIRPILESEIQAKQKVQTRFNVSPDSTKIIAQLNEKKQKVFNFDRIFRSSSSQQDIYNGLNIPLLVEKVLDGFHSTIFAYGQTGSGKTYTIDGPSEDSGLIPRTLTALFESIQQRNNNERSYRVNISFLQIYNEGIYDLIDITGKPLKMRWNKHQQFTVQSLFEAQCRNKDDAVKWWKKGQKNKIMGAHKMNAVSSRSHCLLTVKVSSYDLEDPSDILQSKLEIVDLAGSERHKVTKSTGAVFKEGIEINKSLFTLRQVISSLYETSQGENSNKHIPYRDSRLTSLLKQSIGGNTYCAMIACLNPTMTHFEQSFQTLTYASMASYINNTPVKNIDPKIKENQFLRQQNEQYRQQIKKMSDHIEKLTKMLQAGVCAKCSQSKTSIINSSKLKSQEDFLAEIPDGPTGLKILPKVKSRPYEYESQSSSQALDEKSSDIKIKNRIPSVEKKTLKTTKEILESITMIKQLINANTGLREKIQILKNLHEKQEKQIYSLMKENQVLRDRWDMVNGAFIPEENEKTQNEAPIVQFEKMIRDEKGVVTTLTHNRLHSQNSTATKNTNYNEFLMKNMRRDLKPKKKKHGYSMSKPSKIDSWNF